MIKINSISDAEIKNILFHRNMLLGRIRKRIKRLYDDLDMVDELIRSASIYSPGEDRTGGGSKGNRTDLLDVLLRYENLIREQKSETRVAFLKLAEEQEKINRVWVAYEALPDMEHEIVTELYVQRELYRTVEELSGLNHREFENTRKRAMKSIRTLYESGYSNMEIMRLGTSKYEQLCLHL